MAKQTILMTGAAGGAAALLRPYLREHVALRLSDRAAAPGDLVDGETWQSGDLTDPAAMAALVDGVDGVIHLGGQSVEADWDTVRAANFDGLFNILTACRNAGVPRFIFASSNHTVGFYPRTRRIGTDTLVRPDGLYGVSKAFGEALVSMFCDKHALRAMSIRIGNVAPRPADKRRMSMWIHPEDLADLIMIGLTHPDVHHSVVYGISNNERGWWDNKTAFDLGYAPKHDAEDHAEFALAEQAKMGPNKVGDAFQGGPFCADGFSGDLDRTIEN